MILLPVFLLFELPSKLTAFVEITRVHVGNKVYTERNEQPWFRTPHFPHKRVDPEKIAESGFGQHFVPEDDVFVSPEWKAEERKYLPCMDRLCLCPLEIIFHRKLKDYNVNMGVPYWDSSLDALLPQPKDSIMFSEIFLGEVDENNYVMNGPYHNWTTMEGRAQILREFDSDPSGELLNNARIDWIINNPNINHVLGTTMPLETCPLNHTLDPRMLEYSHDYVHFFISGDMGRSYSSSNDVIFIYHHSIVDWIFESWRQKMQTRTQRERDYPPSDSRCFPEWHFAEKPMPMLDPFLNRDALSNAYTDELYEFAPRPNCTRENQNCESKYLFCYIPENYHEDAYCMSKVKMGGDCSGFEKFPICYEGACRKTPGVISKCHRINRKDAALEEPRKLNPHKLHLKKPRKLFESFPNPM